jgi:hypothetical protein
MGKVMAQAIMSLDGYVARQDSTIGRLCAARRPIGLRSGRPRHPSRVLGGALTAARLASGGRGLVAS